MEVEYEGTNAYCTHCGLLGQVIGMCRTKYPHLLPPKTMEKNAMTEKTTTPKEVRPKGKQIYTPKNIHAGGNDTNKQKTPISILKRGEANNDKVHAVLKEVGLESSDNSPGNEVHNGVEDNHSGSAPQEGNSKMIEEREKMGREENLSTSQIVEERVAENIIGEIVANPENKDALQQQNEDIIP